MRSATAKMAVVSGGDGEGDGQVAAVEHHDEGERHGGRHARGDGAGGETCGGRLLRGSAMPWKRSAAKIEDGGEHHREQREGDRAVELGDAQVGEHQRQQRRHDGGQRVEAGGDDRQPASAPEAQASSGGDGERRAAGEDEEARDVVGQTQHAFQRRRQQARFGRRGEAGPYRDCRQRDDAGKRSRRGRRRTAPGSGENDGNDDGGE